MPGSALERGRLVVGSLDLVSGAVRIELGRDPNRRELAIYRVLGVRQLAQAGLTGRYGHRRVGAVVDLLHAASMALVLGLGPSRWRRGALVQLVLAAGFAAGGMALRRS